MGIPYVSLYININLYIHALSMIPYIFLTKIDCQRVQQPKQHQLLHEVIMMMSDTNSVYISISRECSVFFRINVPKELQEFPSFPYPKEWKTSYITRQQCWEYLNMFTDHFNIRKYIRVISPFISDKPCLRSVESSVYSIWSSLNTE